MEVGMVCQIRPIKDLEEISNRLAHKHPDLHLHAQVKERLATLQGSAPLHSNTTLAIAVLLESPPYLAGLQEKDPPFQAWKQASYDFLSQEFGKENLVYLHLNQEKAIPAIHCIFVPIQSHQLVPEAFVGTSAHQEGYQARYQAVLDHLSAAPHQASGLQAGQGPKSNQHHRAVSLTNYEETIKDGLDRIKRINLVDYLIHHHGYQKNKQKSSKKWLRLDHGDGTKLLLHEDKGIHYYESLHDEQDRGTIVDYMLQRGRSSYQEVIAEVSGNPIYNPIPISHEQQATSKLAKDPLDQQACAQAKLDRFPISWGRTYLEQRGIERATYQGIEGVKTSPRGAIFGLYTKVAIEGPSQLCSTIQYYLQDGGESGKYFQKDLPRGLSVWKPNGAIKEIFVTESPIDALSHQQLHGNQDTLYVSTFGSIGKEIARSVEAVLLQGQAQSIKIKLGFDQDEAGRKMAEQVAAIASKHGISCQMEWPKIGKDWNDMLLANQKEAAQLAQPQLITASRGL